MTTVVEVVRGHTATVEFQVLDVNGDPEDISAYTATLALHARENGVAAQKVLTSPSTGVLQAFFTRAEWTSTPLPAGDYDAAVWLDDGDGINDDNIPLLFGGEPAFILRVKSIPQRVL